jgi:methylthioribose-1-phosphate isomerase
MSASLIESETIRAIKWRAGRLYLLDQRRLPQVCDYRAYDTVAQVADAIRTMVVRGAPAIGIAAAYGVVLAARQAFAESTSGWRQAIAPGLRDLAESRPTAVNLAWAIASLERCFDTIEGDPEPALLGMATAIHEDDIKANRKMGDLGADLLPDGARVITHCNAGALATGGYGTALGVIRAAFRRGRLNEVYVNETRPWLQGARLTAWELVQEWIPTVLMADNAAAYRMQCGGIDWIMVGADRIAANGDVANKIGTYGLAVLARAHGVKFMVVAPTSTVDLSVASGGEIPIEDRSGEELLNVGEQRVAAAGVNTWNPVFDVTLAELIDVIVTERGAIDGPTTAKLEALMR